MASRTVGPGVLIEFIREESVIRPVAAHAVDKRLLPRQLELRADNELPRVPFFFDLTDADGERVLFRGVSDDPTGAAIEYPVGGASEDGEGDGYEVRTSPHEKFRFWLLAPRIEGAERIRLYSAVTDHLWRGGRAQMVVDELIPDIEDD